MILPVFRWVGDAERPRRISTDGGTALQCLPMAKSSCRRSRHAGTPPMSSDPLISFSGDETGFGTATGLL